MKRGDRAAHRPFTFKVDPYLKVTGRSNGSWYCSGCDAPAVTEHNKPECHTCSDWNGCGQDCTLSKLSCRACGTEQIM